jgi:hypothetical protein
MKALRTTVLLAGSLLLQGGFFALPASAGGLGGDLLNLVAPGVGTALDDEHRRLKEHNPDYGRAEAVVTGIVRNTLDPETLRACAHSIDRCAQQVLSAPLGALARGYIADLEYQAQGRLYPFTDEFINLVQAYYPEINLRNVRFADDINTGHGMTLATCNRIYFAPGMRGSVWRDRSQLRLVLHELEHVVQCQRRGETVYLAEYLVKAGADVVKNRSVDVHDVHDFEVAADAKADRLTDILWDKIQSGSVARPGDRQNYGQNQWTGNQGYVCRYFGAAARLSQPQQVGTPCFVWGWGSGITSAY